MAITMNVPEKLKARRTELGLSRDLVARCVGLSWNEYFDVEGQYDEMFLVTQLATVKKLCALLGFNLLDLCDFPCVVCGGGQADAGIRIPRHELIRKRRLERRLSQEELGDRLGWDAEVINSIETNPDHLESWTIDNIQDLAKELELPLQILLAAKCEKGH